MKIGAWYYQIIIIDASDSSVYGYSDYFEITNKQISDGDYLGYFTIDLGLKSELSNQDFSKFRVFDYDKDKMIKYHNETNHKYVISKIALEADTIINLPKLKVHKKAGITSSLKNFVGIIGSKDCLPHHRFGSIEEGGDEYYYKSLRKRLNSILCDSIGQTHSISISCDGKTDFSYLIENQGDETQLMIRRNR